MSFAAQVRLSLRPGGTPPPISLATAQPAEPFRVPAPFWQWIRYEGGARFLAVRQLAPQGCPVADDGRGVYTIPATPWRDTFGARVLPIEESWAGVLLGRVLALQQHRLGRIVAETAFANRSLTWADAWAAAGARLSPTELEPATHAALCDRVTGEVWLAPSDEVLARVRDQWRPAEPVPTTTPAVCPGCGRPR